MPSQKRLKKTTYRLDNVDFIHSQLNITLNSEASVQQKLSSKHGQDPQRLDLGQAKTSQIWPKI